MVNFLIYQISNGCVLELERICCTLLIQNVYMMSKNPPSRPVFVFIDTGSSGSKKTWKMLAIQISVDLGIFTFYTDDPVLKSTSSRKITMKRSTTLRRATSK